MVYQEQNRARARVQTKQRLLTNTVYQEQSRARARLLTQRRRSENSTYRQRCVEWAKAARKARLQDKREYWKKDCAAATVRKRLARNSQARKSVHSHYTARQLCWIKRRRMLSAARRRQQKLHQQEKMMSSSKEFLLDIKLLFTRSEKATAKGVRKIQFLHRILSDRTDTCLDKISDTTNPNEIEITAAMGEVRIHTTASEPYFWEQVYRKVSSEYPIPIDSSGKARLFTPHEKTTQQNTATIHKDVSSWHCNANICHITADMITGTVRLLHLISSATPTRCLSLYTNLNQCQNPNRTDSLGHPLDCKLGLQLFQPATSYKTALISLPGSATYCPKSLRDTAHCSCNKGCGARNGKWLLR